MDLAPRAAAAFDDLLAALTEARDRYVRNAERHHDELEVLEGYRYLLHVLSEGTDLHVEGDPERPSFSKMVWDGRKFLGDNPDAIYYQALIRGDRRYRIRGRKDQQCYLSFTVHGPAPDGGINGPVQADINDDALRLDADGRFELVLGPGGDIELQPDARCVIVRNYFSLVRSAQTDPSVHVDLEIEPLDDPGAAPPLDDATMATRLQDLTAFFRATTVGTRVFGGPPGAPFVAAEPNDVGTPWSFRNAGVDAAGAVDIFYSSGTFDLGPDDAIVMEGSLPPSRFTNVMLWNVHMQTLDYRSHRCSLNAEQIETDADGRYRIVISAEDPGVPNWLDTAGHRRGTIFWRFLLPDTDPEQPRCRVVPVGEAATA